MLETFGVHVPNYLSVYGTHTLVFESGQHVGDYRSACIILFLVLHLKHLTFLHIVITIKFDFLVNNKSNAS